METQHIILIPNLFFLLIHLIVFLRIQFLFIRYYNGTFNRRYTTPVAGRYLDIKDSITPIAWATGAAGN